MNKIFKKRKRTEVEREFTCARNKEDFSVKTNMRKRDFCLVRKLIGRQISTNEGSLDRLNLRSLIFRTIFFRVDFEFSLIGLSRIIHINFDAGETSILGI